MNVNHLRVRRAALLIGASCCLLPVLAQSFAAPVRGLGRAVIAGMTEEATVRFPEGSGHDGGSVQEAVAVGQAFTEGHTLETNQDGRLCVVLTPGAVLCVGGDSRVKFVTLREMPKGLPGNEQELIRTINLSMKSGSILFYGGTPSPNNKFKVLIPGGSIETSGATFECHQETGQWVMLVREGEVVVTTKAGKFPVATGEVGELELGGSGKLVVSKKNVEDLGLDEFELCEHLYPYLDPLVFHVRGAQLGGERGDGSGYDLPSILVEGGTTTVDVDGLADFLPGEDIFIKGDIRYWSDVSPASVGRVSTPDRWVSGPGSEIWRPGSSRVVETPDAVTDGRANLGKPWGKGRLKSREWIWNWYRKIGVIKGVNYIPRDAVNAIEMWQAETFNPELIDEELAWAHDVGYNAVRVALSFTVWEKDPKGYLQRIEDFLDLADDNHLDVAFVLLDDSRHADAPLAVGEQPAPIPGVYNSQWGPSPGAAVVLDQARWGQVESYVRGIIGEFAKDQRVLFWDVYHNPGHDGLWDKSLPLLEVAFAWARDEEPRQPLTAGPWMEYMSPMSVRIMELSDFISLQTFDDVEGVKAKLLVLAQFDRPILCTDWLKRGTENTFENLLPLFSQERIGWFNRGLVKGKTQLHLPEKGEALPENVWQQNVLDEDGAPYDQDEIELIRDFDF